jgi:DNA-binding NarL/FixJ family response regulator
VTVAADPVRVLLVDDEPMVCAHLRTILGSDPDLLVVGEVHDGDGVVAAVLRERPHVVLMDLRMPVVDGITATARVAELTRPPHVVVLTTFDADRLVLRALQAGASGFLLKSTAPHELVALVRAAAGGHSVMTRSVSRSLVSSAVDRERARRRRLACLADLTGRETDVLACLARGLSNGEIAAELSLSEPTVKGHISRILVKTGSANRTQAGLLGFEAGLGGDR